MYGYGMVLLEIASRQIPYRGVNATIIRKEVRKGRRADVPDDCPGSFAKLIKWCWEQDPKKRPTIDEAAKELLSQECRTSTNNLSEYRDDLSSAVSGSRASYRFFSKNRRDSSGIPQYIPSSGTDGRRSGYRLGSS